MLQLLLQMKVLLFDFFPQFLLLVAILPILVKHFVDLVVSPLLQHDFPFIFLPATRFSLLENLLQPAVELIQVAMDLSALTFDGIAFVLR